MVLLFDSYYFDPLHPYCAREYLGMKEIERRRKQLAGNRLLDCGLIIPVVIRGEDSLPDEIAKHRQCISLERILLQPADFRKTGPLKVVQEIARLVYQRYQILHSLGVDLSVDCPDFDFPSEEEANHWLHTVAGPRSDRQLPLV
jgi:hypothetical protein